MPGGRGRLSLLGPPSSSNKKARPSRDAVKLFLVVGGTRTPLPARHALFQQQKGASLAGRAATFSGYMGKRKAVDPCDPLTDCKKQKKRSLKLVTKTKGRPHKPFEDIDQFLKR
ncbi:hypothetical protein NDU88_002861 [Pleurodeles waltl]|uniref:Active regulator of SIRT1 n=1 Tax=Pleurodeles waltl TaxID=8319 RepID=A0AAV7MYK7_PLEWA|nr:hypothetical protein NDU88_002861 [Pleurodeles waltl]